MNFIQDGDLEGLYQFMGRGKTVENVALPLEHTTPSMPNPYYPVAAIKDFVSQSGDVLWKLLQHSQANVSLLREWLDSGGDINIRHPVTGNYIPHENLNLFMSLSFRNYRHRFRYNPSIIENFVGLQPGVHGALQRPSV